MDQAQEPPTHHELDGDALNTWVYPTNLGPIRDYQYTIVRSSLFSNTLVALPTGLGKTFIAATVMLNFYRWTRKAKIVFVAPTKPLVSQQVDACFTVAGIPRCETTLLTGEVSPGLRAEEWQSKRVFFMTPQTLQNDLSNGMANPKDIVLLVIDEAHRATGEYAYAKVVKFMRRFNDSFRILALTATPGSKVEGVQEIINNLGISHVEIRTEDSLDIRQYVQKRYVDQILVDPSDEIHEIRDLFSKALKPLTHKLSQQNIYWGRDPMQMTTFGLLKNKNEWLAGPGRHAPKPVKLMIQALFAILQSLAHSIKLLNFHGIRPFYANLKEFRDGVEAVASAGSKGPKNKKQLIADKNFQEMMQKVEMWMGRDDFISHPKILHLCDTVLSHFLDHGKTSGSIPMSGSGTRIIIFSEYRDSAEDIVKILNKHRPLVRASVFVGQADSKRSEGMNQKMQLETIRQFKKGELNVLVATSIGEEGLDIGQVDLIICYDASASPIRMLQRMGRTGRQRAGKIVLLLMRGKEEDNYQKAKDNYAHMQSLICEGSRFDFRYDLSSRIVPLDAYQEMQVDKRAVDIPIENTQNPSLPEPKKSKKPRKPPKKFHMPDNVETGFQKASHIGQTRIESAFTKTKSRTKPVGPQETDYIVSVPPLHSVLLSKAEMYQFTTRFKAMPSDVNATEEIPGLELSRHPEAQRRLQKACLLQHGSYTARCVKTFRKVGNMGHKNGGYSTLSYGTKDDGGWKSIPVPPFAGEEEAAARNASQNDHGGYDSQELDFVARQTKQKRSLLVSSGDSDAEGPGLPPPKKRVQPAKTITRKGVRAKIASKPRIQSTKQVKAAARKPDALKMKGRAIAERDASTSSGSRKNKGEKSGKRTTLAKKRGRINDAGEDHGDSCMQSDDLVVSSDGSDNGSDLEDFIVGDDVPTSQLLEEEDEDDAETGTMTSWARATLVSSGATPVRKSTSRRNDGDGRGCARGNGRSRTRIGARHYTPLVLDTEDDDDDDLEIA